MLRAPSRFYEAQQDRISTALLAIRSQWAKLSKPSDFRKVANQLLAIIMGAQLGAAKDGAAYVPAALAEQGLPHSSPLEVNPGAFAGWATLLRDPGQMMPLETLLWTIPERAAGAGGSVTQQMAAGARQLDLLTQMQISDAGRMSTTTGMAARVKVGYYRHVRPPCCADCAQQAGKFFRNNAGFARHPNCDCVHVPAYEDRPVPDGYAEAPPLDQVTGLSAVERQAIEDGGDLSMVVNARRGSFRMYTTESTTPRGYASYLRRSIDAEGGTSTEWTARNVGKRGAVENYTQRNLARRRLSPEGIYKVARTQEEAVLLLIKEGYVVGDISKLAKSAVAEMRRLFP